jgi:hypothetical protein
MNIPATWQWRAVAAAAAVLIVTLPLAATGIESERRYLSGRGPADAVPWEFSVTDGRRAREATTLPVPSHWELHGFGTYNYGQEQDKGDERGLYRLNFTVPAEWQGRRIRLVFDGVMTDASVKVNGRAAGPVHQGGFTRFRYDISALVKTGGDNLLEVDVAKVSANADTERAERSGDYWVFGGIYRPVWLEAVPALSIEHVAIDARADGTLAAEVTLAAAPTTEHQPEGTTLPPERIDAQVFDLQGRPFGGVLTARIPAGGAGRIRLEAGMKEPRLWTAETPHLYTLRVTRHRGDEAVHTVSHRFGFRTFEVRDGDGLYLNGRRILLKGVNRHSFRPDTGRSLTREDCYADVRLIRSMNMNAVRMSHYPPDEAFLEACDELGLYVLNELSGWQHAHDTVVGRLLVREFVERDVNHPSILFWNNGNERGWNRDLDGEFALYDPQRRRVLHPSDTFGGIDTKHYTDFEGHARRLRGPNLVMPTEILHAMYDGGAGAGLADYWGAIERSPFGAGAFIWMLADEGVVRTDDGGRVDVFSTFAADGILGPRHEKEGSFYTVRDIWSPVQIEPPQLDGRFDGTLVVHNRYDFTALSQCRFAWQLVRFDPTGSVQSEGWAPPPDIAPGATGKLELPLPARWRDADALFLTVSDPRGDELWRWSWATPRLRERTAGIRLRNPDAPGIEKTAGEIRLSAAGTSASFDAATGRLISVRQGGRALALTNGPRLTFARPPATGTVEWLRWQDETNPAGGIRRLATPQTVNLVEVEIDNMRGVPFAGFKLEVSPDGGTWKTLYDGTRRPGDGTRYEFPPQPVAAVRISNVFRSDRRPATLRTFRVGGTPARFPGEPGGPASVTSGTERDRETGETTGWVEARGAGGLERHRWTLAAGTLRLDYAYELAGEMVYHGITFDHPESAMKGMRWLGEGPYRVWQNRLRGTWLGVHENTRHEQQPGHAWHYPEFEGFFAGVRWARLETVAGPLTMTAVTPGAYLRVGTPRITHFQTTVDFPAGDLSWLHAISGMGSKFRIPEVSGPSAQPVKADGRYEGTILFQFE